MPDKEIKAATDANIKLIPVPGSQFTVIADPSGATFMGFKTIDGKLTSVRITWENVIKLFNVVQATGQSITDVMSQKAVTNEFDRFTTNIDDINDGLTVINQMLDDKVSKSDIVQSKGQSATTVMSQKAVTDQLEIIDSNIDGITDDITGINQTLEAKVNKTDIINDLITGRTDKVLSAAQGMLLKQSLDNHSDNKTDAKHIMEVSYDVIDSLSDYSLHKGLYYLIQSPGFINPYILFVSKGISNARTTTSQLLYTPSGNTLQKRFYISESQSWTDWEDVTSVKRSDITNDTTLLADETRNGLLKKEHYKIIEDMEKNFDNLVGEVKRIADAQGSYIGSNYTDKISIQHINETSLALDYATIAANGDYKIVTKNDLLSGAVTNSATVPVVLSQNDYVRIFTNKTRLFELSAGTYPESVKAQSSTMTTFSIKNAGLKSASVSSCPELNELYLYGNNIESINVSNNPKLSIFVIYNNKLKTLNISRNTALQNLQIGGNTDLNTLTLPTGSFSVMSSFLADRTALTLDTIMQVADKLPDRTATTTGVCRIPKTVYDSMTTEQKAVISNKNFNLIGS